MSSAGLRFRARYPRRRTTRRSSLRALRPNLATAVFLWAANDDPHLSTRHRSAVENTANEVYVSVVSIWEATVKYRLGKLPLPNVPHRLMPAARERLLMISLDLDEASVLELSNLPDHHKDPFDRMLICQARAHGLTLVTTDAPILAYPVATLP